MNLQLLYWGLGAGGVHAVLHHHAPAWEGGVAPCSPQEEAGSGAEVAASGQKVGW